VQRKRDGDGDGFVDDGTPLERPWVPGVDLGPVEDAAKAKPKVPGGQQVPADVAVKRGRVGNVDTPRLQRRRERLISEIDDPGQFYKGGRHGFAMRAAELTVIESELVKRGDLKVKDRYTVSIKDKVEVPDWENGTELRIPGQRLGRPRLHGARRHDDGHRRSALRPLDPRGPDPAGPPAGVGG
jgi:hypothetical protein